MWPAQKYFANRLFRDALFAEDWSARCPEVDKECALFDLVPTKTYVELILIRMWQNNFCSENCTYVTVNAMHVTGRKNDSQLVFNMLLPRSHNLKKKPTKRVVHFAPGLPFEGRSTRYDISDIYCILHSHRSLRTGEQSPGHNNNDWFFGVNDPISWPVG